MTRTYKNKTVIVTGAAGGLGWAICERFGRAGARIGALDQNEAGLQKLSDVLFEHGIECHVVACDITDEVAASSAIQEISVKLGAVHALVNNAGITHLKNFSPETPANVDQVMRVNFMGAVHCTGAAFDSVVAERGQFIAISSVAGFAPLVGRTAYCASKHALRGFFNTLRCELRGTGVDVLVVCPSFVATGLRDGYRGSEDTEGRAQTVGSEATPEYVADLIYRAAEHGKRELVTGPIGKLSEWIYRISPKTFEAMMLRKIRPEN